jgi:hypothetical protein
MWHSEMNRFGYWVEARRRQFDHRKQPLIRQDWQEFLTVLLRAMSALHA